MSVRRLLTAAAAALLGGFSLAAPAGRAGTGNGRGGAIAAVVLALVGMVIGGLALARSRRTA